MIALPPASGRRLPSGHVQRGAIRTWVHHVGGQSIRGIAMTMDWLAWSEPGIAILFYHRVGGARRLPSTFRTNC